MSDQTLNLETLPCPFCGGKASIEHVDKLWEIGCTNFDMLGADKDCCGNGIGTKFATKREAIKGWNTRAEVKPKFCDSCSKEINEHCGEEGCCGPTPSEISDINADAVCKHLVGKQIPAAMEMMLKLFPLPENEENEDIDLIYSALQDAQAALRPKPESQEPALWEQKAKELLATNEALSQAYDALKRESNEDWPDLRGETQDVLTWAHNVMMCCNDLPADNKATYPVEVFYLRALCEKVNALEKARSDRMLNFFNKKRNSIEGGS